MIYLLRTAVGERCKWRSAHWRQSQSRPGVSTFSADLMRSQVVRVMPRHRWIARSDSQARSGSLLARFVWSQLTRVASDSAVLPLTLGTVFVGGLARLRSWQQRGRPHPIYVGAIALELVGMPILLAWQRKVVARANRVCAT